MARQSGRHKKGSRTRENGYAGKSGWEAWQIRKRPAAAMAVQPVPETSRMKRPAASMPVKKVAEVTRLASPFQESSLHVGDLILIEDAHACGWEINLRDEVD